MSPIILPPPLPDWYKEVVPGLQVYKDRTPENYIKALLQLNVHDTRYVKSKLGTRCNWVVHDGCQVLGCPMPRSVGWPMLANDMQTYWDEAVNGWQQMQWQDAVMSANLGYPTVTSKRELGHGHTSWVLPCNPVDVHNIMTMQAGADNFYGKEIVYGYGRDLSKVKFYGHP